MKEFDKNFELWKDRDIKQAKREFHFADRAELITSLLRHASL